MKETCETESTLQTSCKQQAAESETCHRCF